MNRKLEDLLFQKGNQAQKTMWRLLLGLLLGGALAVSLYFGCKELLRGYFYRSGYLYQKEKERYEELQSYVQQNQVKALDEETLRSWSKERNIQEFCILRDDVLIFDMSYEQGFRPGALRAERPTAYYLTQITFADGEADVYLYEGAGKIFYRILLIFSVFAGFASYFYFFISYVKKDMDYILSLKKEVEAFQEGCLDVKIKVSAEGEIAQLAAALEQLRLKWKEKKEEEEKLLKNQKRSAIGLAHDLRTPMTGWMNYMELLRSQGEEEKLNRYYLDKAFAEMMQVKRLSDQMFEFLLLESDVEPSFDPPESLTEIFCDMFSEMTVFLEQDGFTVNTEQLEFRDVFVQIDSGWMGRIWNNLLSNLEKYGDRSQEVNLSILYQPTEAGVSIQNVIKISDKNKEHNGVGMVNVASMMKLMNGRLDIIQEGTDYQMILWFPLKAKTRRTL